LIDAMPRPRPPHLQRERTRHGVIFWYVRIGKGPRIRLRAAYGTPEFNAEYQAAVNGETAERPPHADERSLAWLWAQYRRSAEWLALSPATKRQRENIMLSVLKSAGGAPFRDISRKTIVDGRGRRAATPSMARHFVNTMRGIFRWAVDAELVDADPTRDVKAPSPKTDGHHTWSAEEMARFEARWPLGTRERLAYDILLYTGLRRGDAAIVGKQHVKDGVIAIRTAKTGEGASILIMPQLARSIAAGPVGDLAFVVGDSGRPMTKESFGNWFGDVCRATGVPGRAHGLRKALATRLANAGATTAELEALFAWRGGGMAALYTRKADRVKLALSGLAKLGLENEKGAVYSLTGENIALTGEISK
jgi:integrase